MPKFAVPLEKQHLLRGTIVVEAHSASDAKRVVRRMMSRQTNCLQTVDQRIRWKKEGEYVDFTFNIDGSRIAEEVQCPN